MILLVVPGLPTALAAAAAPGAAPPGGDLRAAILEQINRARGEQGLDPLAFHPTLSELAGDRAWEIAAAGSLDSDTGTVVHISRRLLARGYDAFRWTERATAGPERPERLLAAWKEQLPESYAAAVLGDFEHLGIGLGELDGQPLYTFLFALPEHTVEERRAAPLKDLARVRAAVLAQVNAERAAAGEEPLAPDPRLDEAAQRHAEDMVARGFYAHKSPDGEVLRARLRRVGFGNARVAAENIAKGLFTPEEVVERWMNSRGHRRNILAGLFRLVGVGVAVGEGNDGLEVVWVQDFAG